MKKDTSTCASKDYDFYIIPFPLKAFKKGQKNKYIYSELGKLHPCFSEDCCFDSRLRLESSGFKAEVVVMLKSRLADYKSRNKDIYIEERKHFPFFRAHKSYKTIRLSIVLCLILTIFFILFSALENKKTEKREGVKDQFLAEENEAHKAYESNEIASFLWTLWGLGGRITSFEWKTDGFTSHARTEVKNIYPEEVAKTFPNAKCSSLVFQNKEPLLTVELEEKNFIETRPLPCDYTACKKEVRNLILSQGAKIIEESVNPYSIALEFSTVKKDLALTSIKKLLQYLLDNKLSLSSFSLITSKETLLLGLSFSEVELSLFEKLGQRLCKILDLFFESSSRPEEENKAAKNLVKNLNTITSKRTLQKKENNKLGQLIREDGSVLSFYKDKNGKINKVEEN